MTDPRADIQKIEDTIRNLNSLKEQGLLSAEQADASISALQKQLTSYYATLEADGAIAQGPGAKAGGRGSIMVDGNVTDAILLTGDGNEVNIGTEPRAKKESLRESYLSYVLGLTSPLTLSGVVRQSASEAEMRMELSAVYTALLTQGGPEDEGRTEMQSKLDEVSSLEGPRREQRRLSVVDRINRHNKLVLLGDPGSGKSTFVNFLALCMAGEGLGREDANLSALTKPLPLDGDEWLRIDDHEPTPQPWDHGVLLPVRIILRDFAVRGLPEGGEAVSAEHIWKFIEEELEGAVLNEYIPLLKKELRDHGGLLLFDGLDEVPESERRREQIKQAVESFASSFPRCRFLVTSRTYAYQNQEWKLNGFSEATLAPFTQAQIKQFVEHWYAHIAMIRKQNEQDAKGKAELLKRAIRSNERLMGLAERPLLLTLMASLHAWRGGTLPDKREELYADAVDLLLDWWESQRVVRDRKGNVLNIQPSLAEWLKVDRKKVRDLLNRIA
jgi:predicted NACHT family NTPase